MTVVSIPAMSNNGATWSLNTRVAFPFPPIGLINTSRRLGLRSSFDKYMYMQ